MDVELDNIRLKNVGSEFPKKISSRESLDSSSLDEAYVPLHKRTLSDNVRDVMPYVRKACEIALVFGTMFIGYKLMNSKPDAPEQKYEKPDGDIFAPELQDIL
jgi:hypothetical protein